VKKCRVCKQEKYLDEFPRLSRERDGRNSQCKQCKRQYDNSYYANNPGRQAQIKVSNAERSRSNLQFLWDYYSEHPCVDCGESDPIVLQMDHLRDKLADVSTMMRSARVTIEAEIAKCEVRCANCHTRKTAREFGWYSALLV
jgi:hypothetical protein